MNLTSVPSSGATLCQYAALSFGIEQGRRGKPIDCGLRLRFQPRFQPVGLTGRRVGLTGPRVDPAAQRENGHLWMGSS